MKRLAQRVGSIVRLLLRLIHLGNVIQRDTDFLGYEAFSRMHSELLRTVAPAKSATDAK